PPVGHAVTETNPEPRREVCRDLTTSSANASLRLLVIWTGIRSIRRTYSGARPSARLTFTTNLRSFMVHPCSRKTDRRLAVNQRIKGRRSEDRLPFLASVQRRLGGFGMGLGFQDLLTAYIDLDLLRLGLRFLSQIHL